jgi:hypothetical protein
MEKRFVQKKEYLHSKTVKEKIKGLNTSTRLTMTPQGIVLIFLPKNSSQRTYLQTQ